MKTKPIIEQHIHGCFGVDFNKATESEILPGVQYYIRTTTSSNNTDKESENSPFK